MKKQIIKIKKLEQLLYQTARKFVSDKEANYFAKEYIDIELKKAPRINAIKAAVLDLESWQRNPGIKMENQMDKGASWLINCHDLSPALKLKKFHDELEKRAKQNGIALLGLNNCGSFHWLSYFTDGLAKRDLIGLCMYNGGPECVVPYGGTAGLFGTNPISYAIPTNKEPIIADMATSQIPFFELRISKEKNKKLKPGDGVNAKGQPTLDPAKCLTDEGIGRILPIGGSYKGYIINLLIEVLTGSLVRSLLSTEMSPKYIDREHGGLIMAFDIASFTDLKKFKASVSRMCQTIRTQKPAPGIKKILVPGDNSYKKAAERRQKGEITIDSELIKKLETLGIK